MTQVKMLDAVGKYPCDSLQKMLDAEAETLIAMGKAELVKQFWVDEPPPAVDDASEKKPSKRK